MRVLPRALLSALLVLLCQAAGAIASTGAVGGKGLLTNEEKAWAARHPVLRVGMLSNVKPIEYMQDGKPQGLSVEYLRVISDKTGLEFSYVPYTGLAAGKQMLLRGEIDVLSANRFLGSAVREGGIVFVLRPHVSTGLVITQLGKTVLFSPAQLEGTSVAVVRNTPYEALLRAKLPNARFVVSDSAQQMLASVQDGAADAGVATETFVLPYLDREFKARLQISGVMPDISSQFDFGVREGDTMVQSILEKSLASLTPEESHDIHDQWLGVADFDMPFLTVLSRHYVHQMVLAALALLLLLTLMYQAYRQRARANHNERAKTRFLALTNHEMRSPMNAMTAAVELLRLTPLDKDQQRLADLADRGGQTLLRLLDDVLDASAANAGQLELKCAPVDVEQLARNVTDLHRLRARQKNIALTVTMNTPSARLMLDEPRLSQVLQNLISNAIKFTETGGVDVAMSVSDADAPTRRRLTIEVADTGTGISQQTQARLFQPYAQAADSYKRAGGTGLGLFICRELATLMNGTISLESEQGRGTTVTLSLVAELAPEPAAPKDEGALQRPAAHAPSPGRAIRTMGPGRSGLRILVVEDTPANQEVLCAQLQSLGCRPRVAPDAARALAFFTQEAFDLVLMDADLPDKDGYALTRELRQLEAVQLRARCPIVAISAYADEDHARRCAEADMDDALSKPIRLARLQGVIETWCNVTLVHDAGAVPAFDAGEPPPVRDAIEQDIDALCRATALREIDPALRAARRLHGAASARCWTPMANAVAQFESLMRAGDPWQTDEPAHTLGRIVRAWQEATSQRA